MAPTQALQRIVPCGAIIYNVYPTAVGIPLNNATNEWSGTYILASARHEVDGIRLAQDQIGRTRLPRCLDVRVFVIR
jgi:hypothetical protein